MRSVLTPKGANLAISVLIQSARPHMTISNARNVLGGGPVLAHHLGEALGDSLRIMAIRGLLTVGAPTRAKAPFADRQQIIFGAECRATEHAEPLDAGSQVVLPER
jgi:hypothetical protein